VRSALDLLERECAVVRRFGGTFVAANDRSSRRVRVQHRMPENPDALPEIESSPLVEGWADEAECVRLRLRAGDRVFRARRVRLAKGLPFMAERTTLAAALLPGLADRAFPHCGILDLSRVHGLELGAAHEQASIGAASSEAAEVLAVEEGAPVLILDRVVMTRDGRPVEWRVAECSLTIRDLAGAGEDERD
jgi:GntR family transcriptional regulator